MVAGLSAEARRRRTPDAATAACMSTAGEAEERNAIAAKTGRPVFAGDETINEKRRQTQVCHDVLKFGGERRS